MNSSRCRDVCRCDQLRRRCASTPGFSVRALLVTLVLMLLSSATAPSNTTAQETTHTFPETGKTVSGIFLQYWTSHGGVAQQGYPITDEMDLISTDGKTYRTQFFQRAVFERHPEFAGTPNEVLLKLVGQTFYGRHFNNTPPPNPTVNPTNTLAFKETGHSIGGKFRDYWEKHGGLAQQGYPMTDEFKMVSTDGKEYATQVFQRAVFELHPEFAGTENEVLLRLLGVEELDAVNKPPATATPVPSATPQTVAGFQELDVPQDDGKDHRYLNPGEYTRTNFRTGANWSDKVIEASNLHIGARVVRTGSDYKFGTQVYHSAVIEINNQGGSVELPVVFADVLDVNVVRPPAFYPGSEKDYRLYDSIVGTFSGYKSFWNPDPGNMPTVGQNPDRFDIAPGDSIGVFPFKPDGSRIYGTSMPDFGQVVSTLKQLPFALTRTVVIPR